MRFAPPLFTLLSLIGQSHALAVKRSDHLDPALYERDVVIPPGVGDRYTFEFTGGPQFFTVPNRGRYRIVTTGAEGGLGGDDTGDRAGLGVQITGSFLLDPTQVYMVIVGERGRRGDASAGNTQRSGGGGGGASWVYQNETLLIVGGAGGGNALDGTGKVPPNTSANPPVNGTIGIQPLGGNAKSRPRDIGDGRGGILFPGAGGGGAGALENGRTESGQPAAFGGRGGTRFEGGAVDPRVPTALGKGGYGGGGGAGRYAGGGGSGYTGGNGGAKGGNLNLEKFPGQGGSSFVASTFNGAPVNNPSYSTTPARTGNGVVIVNYQGPEA